MSSLVLTERDGDVAVLTLNDPERLNAMTEAMGSWGRYELGRQLSLPLREREIAIDRTCARCGCEYEWGVHVAYFAERFAHLTFQPRALRVSVRRLPDAPAFSHAGSGDHRRARLREDRS